MDGYYDDEIGKDCKKCHIHLCRLCDASGTCFEC